MNDAPRVGDAERDQTTAALREHYARGRLTHAELDERLGLALNARTARDLAQATADLPADPPPAVITSRPDAAGDPAWLTPVSGAVAWRAARHAHRHEPCRAGRHSHAPPLPVLVAVSAVVLIAGGFGPLRVLLAGWVVVALVRLAHRAHRV